MHKILKLILLMAVVVAMGVFSKSHAGTCTADTYTSNSANSVLTSSKYNSDNTTIYNRLNGNLDGGCVVDGTVEAAALNTTEFSASLNAIKEGCTLSKSDANTIAVDKCIMTVNGFNIKTTSANTVTWGDNSGSSEAASTTYYVYVLTGSTGTTLNLSLRTTVPNNDGYDASSNKVIGRIQNDASSDISDTFQDWSNGRFLGYTVKGVVSIFDEKANNTAGGTATTGGWIIRTLNQTSGDLGALGITLATNVFTLQPGRYRIWARAPAYRVNTHQIRLYNTTAAGIATDTDGNSVIGSSVTSIASMQMDSVIDTVIDVTTASGFRIDHQVQTTFATTGFGVATSFTATQEIFTQVRITAYE